jgi:hypothetical protein
MPDDTRANHWAFQPVRLDSRKTIDHFVDSALREKNLKRSAEAEKRTLIRRLSFDLLGLPPSPEEVQQFVASRNANAYANLVEKYLASPHYGERWARHWLDVVRFAESHGFEMNQPRPNAWPYRDYVIRAFNEDKPYDGFVMEQLAGDALGADEATGFLVGGAWDQVKSPDPVLTANQRADELHDIVSTTGSAFLGLTVGCARCHNHKFDPIPQSEYYAFKAVFAGVQHGERPLRSAENVAREKELAERRQRLIEVESALEQFEPLANPSNPNTNALRAPVNARKNIERLTAIPAKRVRFTISKTTDAEPCIDELEIFSANATQNIALSSNGTAARASSVYPNSDIHRLEHINDGRHGNGRSWISNERGKGWVEVEFRETNVINKIVWGRDREQRYSDRLAIEYEIAVAVTSNEWRVVASSADRAPYKPGGKSFRAAPLAASTDDSTRAKKLISERDELQTQIAALAKAPTVYGGSFTARPEQTFRLHRGDAMQKREAVEPAALAVLPVRFELGASSNKANLTADQQRRLALAQWIANPTNPLTARVMVNRIWQFHFGEGLVSTPSDFGLNGARPTHPELLDFLASEFIEHGWSMKHIHRLIVNSATYRQSSAPREGALAVDRNSRLLWRFPPRRLEAEAIRDSILAVSGKLDLRIGGPGFSFFESNDNYVRLYTPRNEWPSETFRRMVYGTIIRQRPDGVFGAFDCPDAGQIAPKRGQSTTPLQALNLLNSSFIMQQSSFFAERVTKEAGGEVTGQVRRAFGLAFQREPDRSEIAAGTEMTRSHGLKSFCRALLNANEFTHLE